jgi:hypothetical protein
MALFVAPGYFRDAPFPGSKSADLRPAPDPGPAPKVGKVRVKVTRADIRQGIRHDAEYCPVARATSRALGIARLGSLEVNPGHIGRRSGSPDIPLPLHVSARILTYDVFRFMFPFSFTVKVPK